VEPSPRSKMCGTNWISRIFSSSWTSEVKPGKSAPFFVSASRHGMVSKMKRYSVKSFSFIIFTRLVITHEKNDFAEGSKILLDTDLRIILLKS